MDRPREHLEKRVYWAKVVIFCNKGKLQSAFPYKKVKAAVLTALEGKRLNGADLWVRAHGVMTLKDFIEGAADFGPVWEDRPVRSHCIPPLHFTAEKTSGHSSSHDASADRFDIDRLRPPGAQHTGDLSTFLVCFF